MPVYLLTFHAYRSWRPDHPQGYTRRREGIVPPDPVAAAAYDQRALHPPIRFDDVAQQIIIRSLMDTASSSHWRVHYALATANHVHGLFSDPMFLDPSRALSPLKRRAGRDLSAHFNQPGPWFGRGGSRKRITDPGHYHHLVNVYLPRPAHRGWHFQEQKGQWRQ